MAGDWIKMRVGLDRDPRVIRMADYLAEQREFMDWLTDPVRRTCSVTAYEHVTRNVTVALCVTALLVTWGAAREQGDRDGDDLVILHCDLDTLSAIAGLPRFGDAMASVGWAEESSSSSVTLPKFFKDNESPDDRHKRQAAERQARFRAKQAGESNAESNVTADVTVTHREEKRREEKKEAKEEAAPLIGKARKREQGIADWTAALNGAEAIPAADPVFDYAAKITLPHDFLALAWSEFEARHLESGKTYKDWRAAFRKCVRENWYRLWWEKDGAYALTTAGVQAQRAAA